MKILNLEQERKAKIRWVNPTDVPFQGWIDELVLAGIGPRHAAKAFEVLQKQGYGHVLVMGYFSRVVGLGVVVYGTIHMNFHNTNPGFIKHIGELTGLRPGQPNTEYWTEFEDR